MYLGPYALPLYMYRHISVEKLHILHEMYDLFYECINLSRCTVISNCKQVILYVIVRANKLEQAFGAFIYKK